MKKWNRKSWAKMKASIRKYEQQLQAGDIEPLPITKIIKARRCTSKRSIFADGQCCGVAGHKGLHWKYREDGSLDQWPNKKGLKPWSIGYSMTPPGHKSYVHPKDKADEYYMHHNRSVLVKPKKKK